MIDVACQCGASFRVKRELAGKTGKCPKCNALIRIANGDRQAMSSAIETESKLGSSESNKVAKCSQCGAPVPALTYSCPYCGGDVQSASSETTVHSGVSKAGGMHDANSGAIASGIGKVMDFFNEPAMLRKDASNVPDSPNELVTFFSKHIGGVSELHYGPIHRQACEAALTKLRIFSMNDPRLTNVVLSLQSQLEQKPQALSPVMLAGIILGAVGFLGLLLLAFLLLMLR